MEDPTSSKAFTPLATLQLEGPHILHPQACNPTMDLVVLLGQLGQGSTKGKNKVGSDKLTKLALWRMSGSKVWESDVEGRVRGLAWTHDGLYLTVLVIRPPVGLANPVMALEHFSVHTGQVVKTIKLDIVEAGPSTSSSEVWWDLNWTESTDDWPTPQRGSAGMIIDSLSRPTVVEPPQAPNAMPFMLPSAAKAKKSAIVTPHTKLDSFPSLLPTIVPCLPHVLTVCSPDRSTTKRLLTGTLPLGSGLQVDEHLLKLARTCDRLNGFLDIILRGMESVEYAFKEGEKQTMIWREELESCGEQQGSPKEETHAHLFQLLITGRGSPAVAEWLGNRLTGRTIAKWESTLETSYKTIQKVFAESVGPALERIILLTEEMRGWSKVHSHLGFETDSVDHLLALASGFAKLIERMRQQAQQETYAASEWIKWLKYEIGHAAAHDTSTDTFLPSLCDTKLAWYFMKNGFVKSPLLVHLPQQFRGKPPDDLLPAEFDPNPKPIQRSMSEVLAETVGLLTGRSKAGGTDAPGSTAGRQRDFDESVDSSVAMTSMGDGSTAHRASTPEIPSSPDTVSQSPTFKEDFEPRVLELEPWVWANTLIAKLTTLVKSKDIAIEKPTGWQSSEGMLMDTRHVNGHDMTAVIIPDHPYLNMLANKNRCARIALHDKRVLAISFFDDEEIALLLELEGGVRVLGTVGYAKLDYAAIAPVTDLLGLPEVTVDLGIYDEDQTMWRHHYLKTVMDSGSEIASIALNGRKGRRVGCVLMEDGREVEVLDMEEGEDDEEEEEEEMSGIVEE